ncbi:uncharacterized protein CIMG_06428 [Coccidioides immitis RS]|uniref:AB hydrolase-1 domain-containing protein n=3 Tax=Coccidioides immitis TaxID=5501 RepID=J3K841_COCIM|nr:uncharacterized protein CIMG_06428 [Coccidioides immitis RS]EAS30949.3 hypothetical protein CIMG_06428 [Coccidioides immitis RS]KMP03544.1 hypothetical protein CIRG_03236 [Coccidioides immitis RMSCC 2394]TPX23823.1 hypothetical protein DIZ76_013166 [Coccidioides immitis]
MLPSSASTNPTIVLVHGAWHSPECFDSLRKVLEDHGYPTEAPGHPSVGAEPPTKTLEDDVINMQIVLNKLIEDEGKEVVLVGHSYGGTVISNASDGLGRDQRAVAKKRGGIVLAIYLAGFLVPKGATLFDGLGGAWAPWMRFNGEYSYASDEAKRFYGDLSPENQQRWVSKLRHGSKASYLSLITHDPWRHMPCGYILCENDCALPFPVQKMLVSSTEQKMQGDSSIGAQKLLTANLKASHSPFLSIPEKTAEVIEDMIGKICRSS